MVSSAFRATAVPFVAGVLLLAPASTAPQARPAALEDVDDRGVVERRRARLRDGARWRQQEHAGDQGRGGRAERE